MERTLSYQIEIKSITEVELTSLAAVLIEKGCTLTRNLGGEPTIYVQTLSGKGRCPTADEIKNYAMAWLDGFRVGVGEKKRREEVAIRNSDAWDNR